MTAYGYNYQGSVFTAVSINNVVIPANTGVLINTNGLARGKIVKTLESPTIITCSTFTPQLSGGVVSAGTSPNCNYLLGSNGCFYSANGYLAGNKAYLTINNAQSSYCIQ
jgi:hypothetical protein